MATLEGVKGFLDGFGLLEELTSKGVVLSFSKEKSSAFVDLTLGGAIGEVLIQRIRKLNLDSLKLSVSEEMRLQTDVNAKDLYDNFDLDNIIAKLCRTTLEGTGKVLNIRTVCHLIREAVKLLTSTNDKRVATSVSYCLLILSTFENLGLEIKYRPEELKKNAEELYDTVKGSGQFRGLVEGGNAAVGMGMLPMAFEQIEQLKPMLGMFGDISTINFDKITADAIIPCLRTELKVHLLLPGLSEFVTNKILN